MLVGSKYSYALFNTADAGGGAPEATPPPATPDLTVDGEVPAAAPTEVAPNSFSEDENWALSAFDHMQKDYDEDEPIGDEPPASAQPIPPHGEIPEGTKSPSSQTQQTPVTPPVSTPPVAVPAVQSGVPGVGVAGQQPTAQAVSPPVPAADPTKMYEDLVAQVAKYGKEFTDKLAAERYQIDPKVAEELGFTPEQAAFLSKLVAQTHVEVVQSTSQMQAERLPVFVQGLLSARAENQRREDEFFGQWPQLKGQDRGELLKVFQAVNSLNPNLKGADWSRKAGEMASMHFGLPMQTNGSVGSQQPPAGQVPIATPGRVVRPNGAGGAYIPAGPRTTPSLAPPPKGEWENFLEQMQKDYD